MAQDQSMVATSTAELLQAHAELWCHMASYIKSMALHCAVKLGIPNAIHRCGGSASLPKLIATLPLALNKQPYLSRLMRCLIASGIFTYSVPAAGKGGTTTANGVYGLTLVSRLLVDAGHDGGHASLSPLVLSVIMPFQVNAALRLAEWFGSSEETAETPFKMAHGSGIWGSTCRDAEFNKVFNDGMGSDSKFVMALAVRECPEVFKGIRSLVDVGGGNGMAARAIAKAFPHVKCSVLDLPHVVDSIPPDDGAVEFVAGNMMDFIPTADALLLKFVLHDWGDEDCVKILTQCKSAISSKERHGKVLIIDTVVGSPCAIVYEAQVLLDLLMMVSTTGKEREEHQWQKIFMDAGFSRYKIRPITGILSIIEVFV